MKTLNFGNGDRMPILGLGTWKSEPGEVHTAVRDALRIGYRHIDCAPIYGNESEVGSALREFISEGTSERKQIWVTSKLWNNAHSPEDVQPALEKTLSDLQLDYLDLFLIHWPVAIKKGRLFPRKTEDLIGLDVLPISETWSAMEDLVEKGLCRHIGVSNFSISKLESLVNISRRKPEMNQIELHPYLQQTEMLAYCHQNGIHLTAYSPLGSFDRPAPLKARDEPVLLSDAVIDEIAERHGVSPAQILIGWAIHRGTAVIPKSVNPDRIRQNFLATDVRLGEEDLKAIADLDRNRRYVSGSFWVVDGGPYTLENLWDI